MIRKTVSECALAIQCVSNAARAYWLQVGSNLHVRMPIGLREWRYSRMNRKTPEVGQVRFRYMTKPHWILDGAVYVWADGPRQVVTTPVQRSVALAN